MKKLNLENVRIYSNTKDDILDAMDLIDREVYMSNFSDFNTYDKCNLAGVVGIKHIASDSRHFLAEGDNGLGFREYKYLILAEEMEMIEERVVKKIDVKNSLMFDNQIDNLRAAIEYLTEEGYFSDHESFHDYKEGTLISILVADITPLPYENEHDNQSYRYFIPKDKVVFIEPKKLRPFKNVEEFSSALNIVVGHSAIRYRRKGTTHELVMVFSGYTNGYRKDINEESVVLGASFHSLTNLFEDYEYYDNDNSKWKPFGIEE